MPTRRQERIGKRIMQELVEAFRDLKNVNLGFITITKCEVSPDLHHAKVFVSVYGEEEVKEKTLNTLRHNASRLRGMISRPLGTKVVPGLSFEEDETIAKADEMSRLIRQARGTDANPTPLTDAEAEALRKAGQKASRAVAGAEEGEFAEEDAFAQARGEVEEELWGEAAGGDDEEEEFRAAAEEEEEEESEEDKAWKPIDLDALPE